MRGTQVSPRETAREFFRAVLWARTAKEEAVYWRKAWGSAQWTWRAGFDRRAQPPTFRQRILRASRRKPQHPGKTFIGNGVDKLRGLLEPFEFCRLVEVAEPRMLAGPRCIVPVRIESLHLGEVTLLPQLICESGPFVPSMRGVWGVNPVSCLRTYDSEAGPIITQPATPR